MKTRDARRWIEPLVLLCVAALLRVVPGAFLSMGVDDGVTILNAAHPLSEILPSMLSSHEVHPPLYFYYLHFWVAGLRPGAFEKGGLELWFHLSSLPWSLLVVFLTWRLGYLLGGRRVAVLAGMLAAVSDYLVYFALEVRMYPMLSALLLAAAWAVVVRARWTAVLFMALAFFTQYEALFFIAAFGICCALDAERRRWLLPGLVMVAVIGLWTPVILAQAGGQEFGLRESPSWPQLVELFFQMGFGLTWPIGLPGWTSTLPLLKGFGVVIAGILAAGLARADREPRRLLLSLVVVPIVLSVAVSNLTSVQVFEYKYFQPVAPFLFIAMAMLGKEGKIGAVFVACVCAVNVVAWAGFLRAPDWYGPQNWRAVVSEIAPRLEEGDFVVVHPSMMSEPVLVYAFFGEPRLFTRSGGERVVGVDAAQDEQFLKLLAHANRVWFWTTLSHPFVAQQRLLDHLPPPWKARPLGEFSSFWPANRIQVFMLEKRP